MVWKCSTMAGQETRVTRISSFQERVAADSESCLVQIHGPNLGKNHVLDSEEFTIGRDVKNNIVIDLDNVSRRHAMIRTRQGRSYVQDLGSTNGTYLDRQKVTQPTPVPPGVPIRIGKTVLELRK